MAEDLILAVILAVIQGVTEWFPVSSSGHLVLFEEILGYSGGLVFEVALHFGTLMAVFVYFGKDITDIFRDVLTGRFSTEHGRMGLLLIVATIPAAIIGFLAKDFFDSVLSNLWIVSLGFGITGLLLIISSFNLSGKIDKMKDLGYGKSFLIGIMQALAIVPGVSRSGATVAGGVILGLSEKNAMKFAFILAIPIIFGANILAVGSQTLPSELIWATLVSFIVGLMSIHVVFRYIMVKKKYFRWFAVYCLALSASLILWLLFF